MTKVMTKYWNETVTDMANPRMGLVIEIREFGSTAIHTDMIVVAISERMKLKLYHEFVRRVLSPSMRRILFHQYDCLRARLQASDPH
jgi:hypothetical protein